MFFFYSTISVNTKIIDKKVFSRNTVPKFLVATWFHLVTLPIPYH